MPRSRKRHHSHSRSRSRSPSRDRSHEKQRKIDSHEKEGKRRKVESFESPQQKRSVSSNRLPNETEEVQTTSDVSQELLKNIEPVILTGLNDNSAKTKLVKNENIEDTKIEETSTEELKPDNLTNEEKGPSDSSIPQSEKSEESITGIDNSMEVDDCNLSLSILEDSQIEVDSDVDKDKSVASDSDSKVSELRNSTPKKPLTPKQIQKKLDSEQKRKEKIKDREEQRKKKEEEKERIRQEKLKQKQEKEAEKNKKEAERQKVLELKQKEKEMKEEQKRKEKEEKEQKKKEKEEREEQKRKEKEQEKIKKQQEIEEKNKEKQREEEKKQKTVAAFVNFFVAKKSDSTQEEKKTEVTLSNFMPFEIKSDMRLPPARRYPLTETEKKHLEECIETQISKASYLRDLKSGKHVGKGYTTWPYEETDDVAIVEGGNLGETICEDVSKIKLLRVKFLMFHENKRPPYFGTWRKKSNFISARKPFGEDKDMFNYEEDSDDDWEEEEQGESLNGSDDEADKENEDEKDDYEVDNEFFVPHGHLSDDEIDDEENARLSPESQKQKLKFLHDEFEEDMKSKTHKLKPRSIGCIWRNKDGSNIDESIHRYLELFEIISNGQIVIKKRSDIFNKSAKKSKGFQELPTEHVPLFLKLVDGNGNSQKTLIEQFMAHMINNGLPVSTSKSSLIKNLKQMATWRKGQEGGPMKNKFAWFVNDDVKEKYNVDLVLTNKTEN